MRLFYRRDMTLLEGDNPTRSRVLEAFTERFGSEPHWLVRAPGRANLLGAHVDYSEGWVLPGALDRSIWLAARPAKKMTTIEALDLDQGVGEIDSEWLAPPLVERTHPEADWLDYPRGVAWALARSGHQAAAIDVVYAGDIPIGSGLSSSAAVEVAFTMAWEAASDLELDGLERARLGRRVENEYLGIQSGIMDQFTSVHAEEGSLLLLDCRDLTSSHVPLPEGLALVVADSGSSRELAGSAYNTRPEECRRAVELLRPVLPGIRTLRDVSLGDLETHKSLLPETLIKRARHTIEECRRVRAGAQALEAGKLVAFGELIRASHESSRDLYEVSTPELDALAYAAWSSEGCFGARLSGAGFGGCVNALVERAAAPSVERRLQSEFERAFGRPCATFTAEFGGGARIETLGSS